MIEPILVDTSVWIEYLKGTIDSRTNFLNFQIANGYPILTCPVIIQELLQGIRADADYERLKSNLLCYAILETDPVKAAIGSADLFRALRKKGITIRKSNDCLIAYHAIAHSVPLLHNDSDFTLIASGSNMKVVEPSKQEILDSIKQGMKGSTAKQRG